MEYKSLNASQLDEIRKQKLLEIEAEHARLLLDLELAAGVGLQGEQVAQGKVNVALLERQHRALSELIWPPPPPEPAGGPSGNGSEALPVPATA